MQTNNGVNVIQKKTTISVQSAFPIIPQFQNFSLLATSNGQVNFTLPSFPILSGLFFMNINGAAQDPLAGDFTINGNIMSVNANLSIGDKLAGFYQQMASNINPTVMNYRTFFFVATQGQTQFNIGFTPQVILYISVNGVVESTNDYSQSSGIVTLTQGLNVGDNFFGLAIQ